MTLQTRLLAVLMTACLSTQLFAEAKTEKVPAPSQSAPSKQPKPAPPSPKDKQSAIKEISWDNLMPPPDQKVVDRYQAGNMEYDEVIAYLDKLGQQTVTEMNNVYGKLPGYLVPLNMDKSQIATELLLVPTLGACIHVPPPPPNQIVYISYKQGIKVTEAGFTPYWIYGTLAVEKKTSEFSEVLYSMQVDKIIEYQ
ncbi:DUF3299 domain-containing protein [Endozoicomonas sp. Mp262]|uniref:DUF3299 domain-containing protein n=1 Tax=Endozoicomonas sp. Mp262 TaxID=2919499 RepID=UPI0021D9E2EA